MVKRSIFLVTVLVLVALLIGCASRGPGSGTGGKGSAEKIERAGHPPVPDGVTCYVCHKREMPTAEFHQAFGKDCSQCHVKSMWMAAKFPHEHWHLNKIHRTRCTFCHKNLKDFDFTSQCWGCHHIEDETAKYHKDIGIDDISDCAACHEGTSEDSDT